MFLAALFASLGALYLALSQVGQRAALNEALHDVSAVAASLGDHVSRGLETVHFVAAEVAEGMELDGEQAGGRRMAARLRTLPHLRALLVTDAGGAVRLATESALIGRNLADRPWFSRLQGGMPGFVVGIPEAGRFLADGTASVARERRWSIPAAHALEADGRFAGAVVALLNPDYLSTIGRKTAAPLGMEARFYALDGTLLATSEGGTSGIGVRHAEAWPFRDLLPQFETGSTLSADHPDGKAVASFRVAMPGLIVVEVLQPHAVALAAARQRAFELRLSLAAIAAGAALATVLLLSVSIRHAATREASRAADLQRLGAEREAALLRDERQETQRLLASLPAVTYLAVRSPCGTWRYRYVGGDVAAVLGEAGLAPVDVATRLQSREPGGESHQEFLARAMEAGRAAQEHRMREADGSWRWLSSVATRLQADPARGTEIIVHVRDVTEIRHASAHAAAGARLASLGEMAAGLAHELKQPLTAISLAAEIMELQISTGDTGRLAERCAAIVCQARRGADIIEHLRRFARGSDADARPVAFDLRDTILAAVRLMKGSLDEAGVSVVIAAAPGLRAIGHPLALEQVIVNLVSNALDALNAPGKAARREIVILAEPLPQGRLVRISVSDTGGGIPPHVLDRVFQPFVTTKDPDKGTGLGLSICHGLVSAMGGTISARNEAEGALFTIQLPADPAPGHAAWPEPQDS